MSTYAFLLRKRFFLLLLFVVRVAVITTIGFGSIGINGTDDLAHFYGLTFFHGNGDHPAFLGRQGQGGDFPAQLIQPVTLGAGGGRDHREGGGPPGDLNVIISVIPDPAIEGLG